MSSAIEETTNLINELRERLQDPLTSEDDTHVLEQQLADALKRFKVLNETRTSASSLLKG
jgi:hypothetical protein